MANQNQYDVIIIGSGAGGGTLAYKLAPTGKRILILERGVDSSAMPARELKRPARVGGTAVGLQTMLRPADGEYWPISRGNIRFEEYAPTSGLGRSLPATVRARVTAG